MSREMYETYEVVRSKRKTMSLSVTREGKAVVRAPLSATDEAVRAFVSRHAAWLERRLREYERGKISLADGETIEIAGRPLRITAGPHARICADAVILPAEGRERALEGLLRRLTRQRMKALLDAYCGRYGFSYASLTVTSARGRWGSCSSKRGIAFSFRTAFLPDRLAEYLAVHELCHTRRMDHSAGFWREVGRILPDYAARRAELKKYLWATCL